MSNILGIDWGSKRIGLAIGNLTAGLAAPLATLRNDDQVWQKLSELINQHDIHQIVLGFPRGLDGQITAQTKAIAEVAAQIKSELKLPVAFQDETLTSQVAITKNTSAGVDAAAAGIILQDYLDSRRVNSNR